MYQTLCLKIFNLPCIVYTGSYLLSTLQTHHVSNVDIGSFGVGDGGVVGGGSGNGGGSSTENSKHLPVFCV